MTSIVYDNDDSHMTYTSVQGTIPLEASGTILFGGSGTCTATLVVSPRLSIVFSGISISLFGWISGNIPIDGMIDGEIQSGIRFDAKEPKTINAIYHSSILSDTLRNSTIMPNNLGIISASCKCSSVIDYATVVAGEKTSLTGKRLIVDESDPSIIFEGSWLLSNTTILESPFNVSVRHPYGNATRQTSSVTASATFHFNGVAVSVVGVNILGPSQSVTVSYNLDGNSTSQVYSFGNSTTFQWYYVTGLFPTDHTLTMTVEDAQNNASFNLDYITYIQSFPPDPQPTSISHGALLGAIIGPILFTTVVVIFLVMRRKKLLFWSSRQRPNTVDPYLYRHPPSEDVCQTRIYHKSTTVTGQTVQIPIDDCDLPMMQRNHTPGGLIHRPTQQTFARWWARIWRCTAYGTLEPFPIHRNPSENHRQMFQQSSALPNIHLHAEQRPGSRHGDIGRVDETIVADPRVQELEELVISLQQEIEGLETRQAHGAQNGALMNQLVRNHDELLDWRDRQGNSISSLAMSTTVV